MAVMWMDSAEGEAKISGAHWDSLRYGWMDVVYERVCVMHAWERVPRGDNLAEGGRSKPGGL